MGMIAARHARECLRDAEAAIAMEVLSAAQACDLRAPLLAGTASRAAIASLRRVVPTLVHDRALKPDVDATIALLRSGELIAAVEGEIGPLE
jgi:histidine ammonia-lyase